MPFYEFRNNCNTLCVKATVGLGKTNTLYDFLKYNINTKYQSCLIVSFRRSLCKKYMTDLSNFSYYENITTSEIDSNIYPLLICQIDSIKRIRGHYDLVIFDEFCSTMNHLITSVEYKKRCFDVFKDLLYDENHIIIMDALLNNEWIDYIKLFNRNIEYIINKYTIHSEKKVFNYGTNITEFENQIRKSIEKKENIVIATNNKKMLNFIDNILVNNYKQIKKLFIKKESKSMYELDKWKDVQVLGYTPSIVAGVSYTEKHFNKCFGLFCNTSSTSDLAFQQLFRVRDISSGEYHICCEITGKNDYPETYEEIKELILKEDRCLINGLENISIDYIKKDIVQDEYFKLFNIIQKNKFLCNNNYNKVLIDILKEQGIVNIKNVTKFDIKDKKLLLKNKKEFNKMVKEEEAIRIANVRDVTEDELQIIKENKDKSEDDNCIIKKDTLKKVLKIKSITKDIILKYNKKGKSLWNLAYIYGYDDYYTQLVKRINYDEKNIDINDDITSRLGRKRKYEQMLICDHILKYIGFNGPLDKNYININKDLIREYIIKYRDIIEGYFRCNKFNIDIFNEDSNKWYKIAKIYINSKLRSIYNISIIDDRKNNKWYIKGLEIWDEIVTYKNTDIISEIKENEIKLFEKIDNNYNNDGIIPNFMDILNGIEHNIVVEDQEEFNYVTDSPLDYIQEYKNKEKHCIKCNIGGILNGKDKCLKCKFKNNMFK